MKSIVAMVILVMLCSWVMVLHAEVTREPPVMYNDAFSPGVQSIIQSYDNIIQNEKGVGVKFDGVESSARLPALAVMAGARCASIMPSLKAPVVFTGISAQAEFSQSPLFACASCRSVLSPLAGPNAFKGVKVTAFVAV